MPLFVCKECGNETDSVYIHSERPSRRYVLCSDCHEQYEAAKVREYLAGTSARTHQEERR